MKHLALTHLITASHVRHGLLDSLINAMVHGFGWRIGTRLASSLPMALLVVLALGGLAYYFWTKKSR